MGTIEQAVQVDIINFCLVALLIMAAVAAAVKIIEEFSKIIGRPVKWIKSNNTDHEQLVELKKEMSDHIQASTEKIEELRKVDEEFKVDFAKIDNDINKLTNMFIEKQISDMRFNIVDVASGITMGMRYSIEQLSHVMHIHDDYEKILAERNMKNGQVDMSMEIIESEYRRLTQAQIHEMEGHNG